MPDREDTESEPQSDFQDAMETTTDVSEMPSDPVKPDTSTDTVEIVVREGDHTSGIANQLQARDDLIVRIEPLEVADYVVSKRVAVKRIRFQQMSTLTETGLQLLIDQLKEITEIYPQPILMVERDLSISEGGSPVLHEFRARLTAEHLNLLESTSASETAELLAMIARREQTSTSTSRSLHQENQAQTLAEQQEYVVASITDLGPVTARTLLEEFASVEAVMSTSKEELLEVPGVGEEIAERIREVVSSTYRGPPK